MKSRSNPFLEPTSTKQQMFLLKVKPRFFAGARTHDLHITSQTCKPLRHTVICIGIQCRATVSITSEMYTTLRTSCIILAVIRKTHDISNVLVVFWSYIFFYLRPINLINSFTVLWCYLERIELVSEHLYLHGANH